MVSDTVVGALVAAGAGLAGALIAALTGLWANRTSHGWNLQERRAERQEDLQERSAERREVRRIALRNQRAADLRELGDVLSEMVTAGKEVIWECVATQQPMPLSDPRAMRVTRLDHRVDFLEIAIGSEDLGDLAKLVAWETKQLMNSHHAKVDSAIIKTDMALGKALAKVGVLLRENELPD
jgi:hypothetical protein